MRNGTTRARRVMGLFGAAALGLGGAVALGAAPASAATITVHTKAQLATAWHNPATTDISFAADIGSCGTMSRSSNTAIALHGNGHVLRATCAGTMLQQTGSGAVSISDTTLRDAIVKSDTLQGGNALNAPLAAVTLDHVLVTHNNAFSGAVHAKSVTVKSSQLTDNGGVIENEQIGSAGAIFTSSAVTVQNSTFSDNNAYGDGAGVRAGGNVTVTGSTFTDNRGKGGGVAITAPNATITNSTFTGNDAYAADGEGGGAVGVTGTVNIAHSTFTHNEGGLGQGGAIGGDIVIAVDTTFTGNFTDAGNGGAIWGHDVRVTRSTFSGNGASGDGGAIHADYMLLAVASTFDSNSTLCCEGEGELAGGAIAGAPNASLSIVNSTLTRNSTGEGGQGSAIYAQGPLRLQFDTIAANPTQPDTSFPAVAEIYGTSAATLSPVRGTLVSGAAPGRDCSIPSASGGSNFDDDGTCGFHARGDVSHGANPQLGALQHNGGPTETRMPAATSPLVNAVVGTCLPHDQRGVDRPRGPACDIGAVER